MIPLLVCVIWCPKTARSKDCSLLFISQNVLVNQALLEALTRPLLPNDAIVSSMTKFRLFVMPCECVRIFIFFYEEGEEQAVCKLFWKSTGIPNRFSASLDSRCSQHNPQRQEHLLLCALMENKRKSFFHLLRESHPSDRAVGPKLLPAAPSLPSSSQCVRNGVH